MLREEPLGVFLAIEADSNCPTMVH